MPRYYQAKEKIIELIDGSDYKIGDKLPTEKELSKQLDVSLITTRRALSDLATEGIIKKEWGKGVYINTIPRTPSVKKGRIALTVLHGSQNLQHPAVLTLFNGLGEVCIQNKYSLEVIFITEEMIHKSDYSEIAHREDLNGIVFAVQEADKASLEKIKRTIPNIIFICRSNISPVLIFDYEDATKQIMEHLFHLGHRNIALLGGAKGTEISNEIETTYKKYLKKESMPVRNNLIKYGNYSIQGGFETACTLPFKQENISAIIAGDDNIALGALQAIRKNGMNCPKDVSLCSFNDFLEAKLSNPPLTSVRIPFYNIAADAGKKLIRMIEGKDIEDHSRIKGELIKRESTTSIMNLIQS
jgi:DNA-binding LacI/PurR family transcriptional regulator